ncbi:HTH-type transcriptional regulator BhcR [Citreimonas salinaria]|uniref:Transcriptional regulator, IclR family n=1 Tax=Citreimonas salinaria TaxID=321339 RepID=A0A1H3JW17_9RHOB|nr:HTH-type transcriptional regulator BhcR [Citreimonas salinaria]SDY44157.1 transcriptional regulator, IclR family [Citreimonas salinaria]
MATAEDGTGQRRARGRPRAWSDTTEQNRIKSLDRAIGVLERLSELGGATLSDLAEATDHAPASLYRILVTLESRGMVDFDPVPQTWHIGPSAFRIGSRFLRRTSLVERARPVLRTLMEATGETANLGIAREGHVLFVSQVETHESIRAFFPPGTMSPMHASGIGKALLAQLPPERAAHIAAKHGLTRFTGRTLTAPEALAADLAQTRRRGYAIDDQEKTRGMRCIAAPIFDMHDEAVAGLSISGPADRLPDDAIPDIGAKVIEAAASVSRGLGAGRVASV